MVMIVVASRVGDYLLNIILTIYVKCYVRIENFNEKIGNSLALLEAKLKHNSVRGYFE